MTVTSIKTHLKEQEQFECFGIPAHVWEQVAEVREAPALPGAGRRNWVYREMEMLGAEATLGVEALGLA